MQETLTCAGCGGEWLHHFRIEVYQRVTEDGAGLRCTIDDDGTSKWRRDDMTNNPSSRRDGVRIILRCELCDAITALTIRQHKGQTILAKEVMLAFTREEEDAIEAHWRTRVTGTADTFWSSVNSKHNA